MAPDLTLLRNISRENLGRALRLKRGKKILIIDPKLTPTLDLIANYKFLQDYGVEKILRLNSGAAPSPTESVNQVLYFIRADIVSAKIVCDQINSNIGRNVKLNYGVVVVPRLLYIVSSLFESEGIHEHVTVTQFAHEMIPLEEGNILSMEIDNMVPQLWLHQDTSLLASVAKAIFNLRGIYGDFQHVVAVGPYAKSVMKMQGEYEKMYANNLRSHNRQESDIPTLILIDRAADFLSALLVPLNYESVLDEVFGIKGDSILFGKEVTGKDPVNHKLTKDAIFNRVRHLHFSQVVGSLLRHAEETKRIGEESAMMNLHQMKKFVENDLQRVQALKKSLALHLGAFEAIIHDKSINLKKLVDIQGNILDNIENKETIDFLEDTMARGIDSNKILRLFSLLSLAQDGLRESKALKTQFVQSYGFKHLLGLNNMENAKILHNFNGIGSISAKGMAQVVTRVAASSPFSSASNNSNSSNNTANKTPVSFQSMFKKLAISSNDQVAVDIVSRNHPSYIFNGKYNPLVSKLTEEVLSILTPKTNLKTNSTSMEKQLEDLMKSYNVPDNIVKCKSGSEAYGRGRNAFVFVIGGITRGEISALQVVAEKLSFNIISGGTDITNGTKLIADLTAA